MERVTFLIEQTGDQLACLLNPESLVIRRQAGVRARESSSGQLTQSGLSDRPLLFTGGGTTEVELELLFDVSLTGSSIPSRNVRELTGPLWELAENREDTVYGRPPLVRFIWGKTFNVPAIVAGVAERLERFTGDGIPTRSWMKMRIVRVDEAALNRGRSGGSPSLDSFREVASEGPSGEGEMLPVTGGMHESASGEEEGGSSITTTSDIRTSAFTSSDAAALLRSAQASVSEAVDALSNGARRLATDDEDSTSEEESTAAEQLKEAAETFDRALEAAAQGVKNGNLNAVGTAVGQMFAAAGVAASATASFVSDAGRAVAEDVHRALDAVGPAAEELLVAAQTAGRAVVQRSARVIATAVATADRIISRISGTTAALASTASNAVREAGTTLQSGLEAVTDVLDRIRAAGEMAAVELLPDALEQISRAADRLWAAGAGTAAEHVDAALETMAVRLKNMKAATEAIGSVMENSVSRFLDSMTDTVASTVDAARESGDFSKLNSLLAQLRSVGGAVLSEGPSGHTEAREQVGKTIHSMEDVLAQAVEREEAGPLSEMSAILPAFSDAVQALEVAEQEGATEAIAAAARDREKSPPAESRREAAPGEGAARHQGQRLDQIAFQSYGDPAFWRLLALHNEIDHPLRLPEGLQLSFPPAIRPSGS